MYEVTKKAELPNPLRNKVPPDYVSIYLIIT